MQDFGFYLVITNPVLGYERCCEEAVKAKVKIVQLRMKDAPREEIVAVAKAMRRITRGTDTLFIVNDDPSIAAEVEADGVHVGQSDMRPTEIRRLYPMIKIIGLSTHNLDQVHAAVAEHPDYIGVGPVFATPTKKIPDPVLGPEMAGRMIAAAPCPAVAIGGINADTLPAVLAVGARNYAVVRAVCGSEDPISAIQRLRDLENA